jgi:hypothetical protein
MDAQVATTLLIQVAVSYANMTEQRDRGGDNHGQVVEYFLKGCSLGPGYPWCAAFVAHCGRYAFADPATLQTKWPLPRTASCVELGKFAKAKNVLTASPQRGDLFLVYYPAKSRFAHTGIVIQVNGDGSCLTIEGNTSGGGSREGWGVFVRTRHFTPRDRFVRWTALLSS